MRTSLGRPRVHPVQSITITVTVSSRAADSPVHIAHASFGTAAQCRQLMSDHTGMPQLLLYLQRMPVAGVKMPTQRTSPTFAALVTAGLVAIAIWQIAALLWTRYRWWAFLLPVFALVVLNVGNLVKYWVDGWRGLDQWPEPHGRFYSLWLKQPSSAGDYYAWLAKKHGNREPWRTWARLDRASEVPEE